MDELVGVMMGLSEQVDLLRSDLAARPDLRPAVTDLSRQVERLAGVLSARPDPARRGEPADGIEQVSPG